MKNIFASNIQKSIFLTKSTFFLVIMMFSNTVNAQVTRTWTGAINTSWEIPTNWSPNGIPNPLDDVIIKDVTNAPIVVAQAYAKSVKVKNNASLTIQSGATLTIDGSSDEAIINIGQLTNEGTILIGQLTAIGDRGITNTGQFKNKGGTLTIDNTESVGIYNEDGGDFDNTNNGSIELGQSGAGSIGGGGIQNTGSGTSFLNSGATINIDNTDGDGVSNADLAVIENNNNGQINIGQNSANVDGFGIYNSGLATFTNHEGIIYIDGITSNQGPAIENEATFYNTDQSIIYIGQNNLIPNHGIKNNTAESVFENSGGTLVIDNINLNAIFNNNGATFTNSNNGQIDIGQNDGNIGSNGLINSDAIFENNNSTIRLDNITSLGINNQYEFSNLSDGQILIGQNGGNIGGRGLNNSNVATFKNRNSTITVDNSTDEGLLNSGFFENRNATLEIDNTSSHGLWNQGEFYNTSGSQLLLGQSGGNIGEFGLVNINSGIFENNNATIIIDHTGNVNPAEYFIYNQEAVFDNLNNAQVIMGELGGYNGTIGLYNNGQNLGNTFITNDASSSIHCYLAFSHFNGATLINHGTLTIETSFNNRSTCTVTGDGIYNVGENWTNDGTFTQGTSTVNFLGSNTVKGTGNLDFYNLTLDLSGTLEFDEDVQLDNQLTLTEGILDLKSNTLTLGADASIIGESNDNYITSTQGGDIRIEVDLDNPNNENPGNVGVRISSDENLGSTLITRSHDVENINGEDGTFRSYTIVPDNVTVSDVTARFFYLDHELNSIPENELAAFRFENSSWVEYNETNTNTNNNWVQVTNINLFPAWTLGQSQATLPVELISFQVEKTNDARVLLTWQTASEVNNEGFEIQHSTDGLDWGKIGFVNSSGDSNEINAYRFNHSQPVQGLNYYRFKQMDFDGVYKYSEIRALTIYKSEEFTFHIFPNPASNYVYIRINKLNRIESIQLLDATGRLVEEQVITAGATLEKFRVNHIPKGIYWLRITAEGKTTNEKIIVK